MWAGYQLGWYGYAVIQQPVTGGCTGFLDLMLPSRVSQVDNCIISNWGKAAPVGANTPANLWDPYATPVPGGGFGDKAPSLAPPPK